MTSHLLSAGCDVLSSVVSVVKMFRNYGMRLGLHYIYVTRTLPDQPEVSGFPIPPDVLFYFRRRGHSQSVLQAVLSWNMDGDNIRSDRWPFAGVF